MPTYSGSRYAVTDTNVIQLSQPGSFSDPLTEVASLIDNVLDFARGRLGGGINLTLSTQPLAHTQPSRRVAHHRFDVAPVSLLDDLIFNWQRENGDLGLAGARVYAGRERS